MNIKWEYERLFDKYGASIYRTIFGYVKNSSDAEDIVQETFYKLYISEKNFKSEEHVRNWLFVTAINAAKNLKRSRWSFFQELDESMVYQENEEQSELFEGLMKLPDKYRIVIILHYYDGYSAKQIAKMLKKSESTILTQLQRGREKLAKIMKGDK